MAVTFLTDQDAVLRYDEQTLTAEQKAQVRENIGASADGKYFEEIGTDNLANFDYENPPFVYPASWFFSLAKIEKLDNGLRLSAKTAVSSSCYARFYLPIADYAGEKMYFSAKINNQGNATPRFACRYIDTSGTASSNVASNSDKTLSFTVPDAETIAANHYEYLAFEFFLTNGTATTVPVDGYIEYTDIMISLNANQTYVPPTLYSLKAPYEEYKKAKSIKVMTFNVGKWGYGIQSGMNDDLAEEKVPHWKRFFKKHDCDIVAVQEFDAYFDVSDTLKCNDEMFNVLYKNYVSHYPQQLKIYSDLDYSGTVEGYVGASDETTQRGYVKTYAAIGGKKVCLMNVHLHYKNDAEGAAIRAVQIADILQILADEEYFILFGDFNTNQGTAEYQPFIDAGYNLANGGFFGYERTFNWEKNYTASASKGYDISIDNIITSPNISVDYTEVLNEYDYLTSDHLAVVANLTIHSA